MLCAVMVILIIVSGVVFGVSWHSKLIIVGQVTLYLFFVFLLGDCLILAISLLKIRRALTKYPNITVNRCQMRLHLIILVASTVIGISMLIKWHQIDAYLFGVSMFISNCVIGYIILLANRERSQPPQTPPKERQIVNPLMLSLVSEEIDLATLS